MLRDPSHLWSAFRAAEGEDRTRLRNLLIEQYLPLVIKAAGVYNSTMKARGVWGELDDLIQDGSIGLSRAVELFDPERGLCFSTYANKRILGAMIDGIRDRDWVPRLARRRKEATPEICSLSRTIFGRNENGAANDNRAQSDLMAGKSPDPATVAADNDDPLQRAGSGHPRPGKEPAQDGLPGWAVPD